MRTQTSLTKLRALMQSDPPVGPDLARACDHDVRELARRCGCSVRRLEQVCQELHRTPKQWLREQRMIHAMQWLAHLQATGQRRSLKSLALELGYRHPDHFRRAFKAVLKVPPRAFLAEHLKALQQFGIAVPPHRSEKTD